MDPLSLLQSASARKIHGASAPSRMLMEMILHRIAAVKAVNVAAAMGLDASAVSGISSCGRGVTIDSLYAFLTALKLKVVDVNCLYIDPDEYTALLKLSHDAISIKRAGMAPREGDKE